MKKFYFLSIFLFFFVVGCGSGGDGGIKSGNTSENNGSNVAATGSVSVKASFSDSTSSGHKQKVSKALADVSSVSITATWATGSAGPIACTNTPPDTDWDCSLIGLPTDISITLNLSAKNSELTEIYTVSDTITLSPSVISNMAVNMQPVGDDLTNLHIPIVKSVLSASQATMGKPLSFDVTVEDVSGETISISYSNSNGGIFSPASDSALLPESGIVTVTGSFTPATKASDFIDTIIVSVADGTGFVSSFRFDINVIRDTEDEDIDSEDEDIASVENFPPAISGIDASVDGAGITTLKASVSDESVATLTYNWSVGSNTYTGNPVVLTTEPAIDTEIYILVTDEKGATHSYSMVWGNVIVSDIWSSKASLNTPRNGLASCSVNGKIYAIGGVNWVGGTTNYLASVEVYDPQTDTWTNKAPLSTPRYGTTCSVVNGKIYVMGGENSSGYLSSVEEYDPQTDTWSTKASISVARSQLTSSVVNGKIYAIGGDTNWSSIISTVEEYNPATNTWSARTSMNRAGVHAVTSSSVNGKIYVMGLYADIVHPLRYRAVEEYDPLTNTWTPKDLMPTSRMGLTSSVVNGKIYVIGGGGPGRYSVVEEYNPLTNSWLSRTPMITSRTDLASSTVNGKIYVLGGYLYSTLSTVEEYK